MLSMGLTFTENRLIVTTLITNDQMISPRPHRVPSIVPGIFFSNPRGIDEAACYPLSLTSRQ